MRLKALLLAAIVAFLPTCYGGTVSGTLLGPTGQSVRNATLSFQLAQPGLAIGSGSIAATTGSCYTSADGTVVGLPDPLAEPVVASSFGTGTLPGGTYYVQIAFYSGSTVTLPSPETVIATTSQGSLIISTPTLPPGATGIIGYVGTTSGGEVSQGQTTGAALSISAPLQAAPPGVVPAGANNTVCSVTFNDAIIPYTGYNVSLISASGNAYPGWPQEWQLNGGANGIVNVSQGAPLWNGVTVYPSPIVSQPLNHGPQSVAGALNVQALGIYTQPGAIVTQKANPGSSYAITWPATPPPTAGGALDCFLTAACSWAPAGSVINWVNPLNYGVGSGQSTQSTTATGSASTITLQSAADFTAMQGVMISHAGAACGSVKGLSCNTAPTPAVAPQGTTGSMAYIYQLACIDGLGGVGTAGGAGSTSLGNTLAGVVSGVSPITGNYNQVTWTGNATCPEVAIYRNNVLIASQYSGPTGTMTFNDVGLTAWTSRDIPAAPQSSALNDNYDGILTAFTGSVATLSNPLGVAISGAGVYHDDAPLIQAAISASKFVQISPGQYIIRYPINYTKVASSARNAGEIYGPGANISCDTTDMCIDAAGDDNVVFSGFALPSGTLSGGASIGLYLARDTATGSLAQNIVTDKVTISIGTDSPNVVSHFFGGRGNAGIYNHAAEIQHNYGLQFQTDRWMVLTSNNIDHVSSLFSATDVQGTYSMSQVDCYSCNGGGYVFGELEDSFTVNFLGGYGLGPGDSRHPWGFETDSYFGSSDNGRTRIIGFRIEGKQGALTVAPGGTLAEPEINVDTYRNGATTPQIYLNAGASLSYATLIKSDDYGGSGGPIAPVIDGPSGNCGVSNSIIFIGIQESKGTCTLTGVGNFIQGPGWEGDWSVPSAYGMNGSTGSTWIKLGTWGATNPAQGATLGLELYGGTGFNTNTNGQSRADIIIRIGGSASGTGSPNISGASLLSRGAAAYTGLKVVATNGSTSSTNLLWDIYVQEGAAFAGGNYRVQKAPTDQWTQIDSIASDPGSASSTVFVGTVYAAVQATTATPTGSCTSNGYIPMVINGATVHVGTCN